MNDDMNKKIQQIAELLGQETMPDNVKGLLSMLAGSLENKEEAPPKATNNDEINTDKGNPDESEDNTEILRKIKNVADKLGTGNDPRINLLHAIKPFMNTKRQKKIGNCIQLLQMTSLTSLLDNQEK